MKTKKLSITPEELNLVSLAKKYSDECKARSLLESLRWPNGVVCPHCQNHTEKAIYKIQPQAGSRKPSRTGLYKCGACRKQFTVTVGTIFEDSHIPISKWLMAIFIMCSSKKAVSSHQLHRMLGLTYKTSWFMAHRLRYAMGDDPTGGIKLNGVVEVDETFVGGKGEIHTKFARQTPVVALIEQGGSMKARVVPNVSQNNLGKVLNECVSKEAVICTDEHRAYKPIGKEFKEHYAVNHSKLEYAVNYDGVLASTNHCESFFSLLKRGVHGSWHNVSREHLQKYTNEFAFRWNNRKITDGERMVAAIPLMQGKRLTYRQAV